MDIFMVLFFLIGFSIAIGIWANRWGRSGIGWFFMAFFFSPLLMAIILAACGRKKQLSNQ